VEIRTTIHEVIARRVYTLVLCAAVGFISYHVGRYTMKRDTKMKEKYGSKKEN